MRAAILLLVCSSSYHVSANVLENELNPITRVAELLQGLQKKVEMDGKTEEDLFFRFKCWCDKVIDSKAASMKAADARIAELEAYLDNLNNGRIELTTERSDLEKEKADLEKDLEDLNAKRDEEVKVYDASNAEMTATIDALSEALKTIRAGAGGKMLLAVVNYHLDQALKVGQKYMDQDKITELTSAMGPDWKKLDKDASFKSKYAAKSTGLQKNYGRLAPDLQAKLEGIKQQT